MGFKSIICFRSVRTMLAVNPHVTVLPADMCSSWGTVYKSHVTVRAGKRFYTRMSIHVFLNRMSRMDHSLTREFSMDCDSDVDITLRTFAWSTYTTIERVQRTVEREWRKQYTVNTEYPRHLATHMYGRTHLKLARSEGLEAAQFTLLDFMFQITPVAVYFEQMFCKINTYNNSNVYVTVVWTCHQSSVVKQQK